ncbi:hypothetical protein [Mesorhizobium sp. Root157]|uniref:hypothetical protein n=1 Tax=Mesorhizobium sp. Root157 TaxID=1736477 RepID=UPI0012E349CE|nr:hypothetical protein [Mesorhizobium sp. Root157]
MNLKNIVKIAIASAVLLAPNSSAYAYSIHYKDGKYSVTCENGDKWTRGDGTQQITHADAANICAKRGSSIIAPDGTKPGTMRKAPSGVIKLN